MGSMALKLQPFAPADPLEMYGRAMSLRAMMDNQRYNQVRMQGLELKAEQDREEMAQARNLRELFRRNPNPSEQEIMSHAPDFGLKVITERRQGETARLTQQKTEVDLNEAREKERIANLTRWVNDITSLRALPEDQRPAAYAGLQQRYQAEGRKEIDPNAPMPTDAELRAAQIRLWGEWKVMEAEAKQRKDKADAANALLTERKTALELSDKEWDYAAKTANTVTDKPSYEKWWGELSAGVRAKIPREYSPAALQIVRNMALTGYQQAQLAQQNIPNSPDEVIAWMEQPGRTPEEISQGQRTLQRMTRYHQEVRPNITTSTPGLVDAVLQNPNLWDNLTPTAKTEIAPEIAKRGGGAIFGKPLSESAIKKMSDTKSAIASLRDLRSVLVANEQYMGPITGLAALNPYSEARKAQADIDRVKQRVGKSLEEGVLRKEDEEKYKKILATLTDVPSTAIYKVDQIMQELERDMEIFAEEQRQAGRRVGGASTTPTGQSDGKIPNPIVGEPTGVPKVGQTFNGKKVTKVTKVK